MAHEGMVRLDGGVVTVGGYDEDPAGWGRRETVVAPCLIDVRPGEARPLDGCRRPRLAELEHALRAGLVGPATALERTSSLALPDDARDLAELEGPGFYEVCLRGRATVVLRRPGETGEAVRRRLLPLPDDGNWPLGKLVAPVVVRRGRGEHWPAATTFLSVVEARSEPRRLATGAEVFVHHIDGAWALVGGLPEEAEPWGWIPEEILS